MSESTPEKIRTQRDANEQDEIIIPVSREQMDRAIAAFPQSKLNRSSSNASLLRIPQREERSDSDVSISIVKRLRELRTKFTNRIEIIKAKEIDKAEVSESESEEEETGTDPTKSDEKELQLGGEFVTKEVVEKSIPWWKRYPNRLLIIRQPLCLMCLSTNRKYFISKPQLPCISIQCTNTENKQVKVEEGIKSPEQENEQSEVIGQVDIQLKQISIPLPAWLVGLKDVFSATISPYSNLYLGWLGFLLIAVLYNYITIPFREAFNIYDDEDNTTLWYTLNSIMDTIYLLDIVLIKPRVEFLDSGIVKTDFKSCGMNYLKSLQFKIDMASIIPLDLFSLLYEKDMARFRVLRLLKVQAFWEAFEKLDQRLNAGYAVRLARTIIYMLYIIHIETCGYYLFNRWEGLGSTSWTIQPGQISPYVYAFYVCMKTATSIGSLPSATNSYEFLFMTCYWLSGILVSAILIGQVIDILDSASANKVNYRKIMDATLSSMQHLHAPEHVVNKVRSWFMYNWDQQKTFDENSLFESLPIKLKSDLAISVHYHTLSKVSLFQNCEKALIYDMILKLKPVVFLPMDYICRKGEVGKEMYIVKSGMVEVVGGPNNSIVFVTLKEGSVFGEISLLALSGKNRRTADVRSKGFSTLFSLSKQDFEEIMKNYPQAHELLKKRSQRMLNRDKKNAKDGAKKEKKKKMQKEISLEANDDDAAIEVIPERPATPKLVETVVKAIESIYPDKPITKRLKGSFSDESGKRRQSSYFISPKYHLGSVKSSNSSEKELERSGVNVKESELNTINKTDNNTLSVPGEPPNQNLLSTTSNEDANVKNDNNNNSNNNNNNNKDKYYDDDEEDEDSDECDDFDENIAHEKVTQQWINLLSVDRNPIKRITSYFPHIC
uniref:Cyclic nucleotide-binding domain-containing protein n=1 Tax=Trichobilharzia regenti TaxID=157069 RepID=A0AA85JKK2_TRIRE|nr:unnamed protein product [Trichobilharzia regenti]